jgi:hypothetical protein
MKTCRTCNIKKPLEEFPKHKNAKDGHIHQCKSCRKQYDREYFAKFGAGKKPNPYYQKLKSWYKDLKSGPCTDCDGVFDPVCMHWDHKPGFERNGGTTIQQLYRAGRKDQILEEIQKCELVCANCHALRTKTQQEARFKLKQEKAY